MHIIGWVQYFVILSSTWSSMEVDGLRCWQCDTLTDGSCGNFGVIQEAELNHYTTDCIPYDKIRRGCYKVQLSGPEAGDNTFLFCAPDLNTSLICNGAATLYNMEGRGQKVEYCDSCRKDLCNSSIVLRFNVLSILSILSVIVMQANSNPS